MSSIDTRLTSKTNQNTADILTNKTTIATNEKAMSSMDTPPDCGNRKSNALIQENKVAIAEANNSIVSMRSIILTAAVGKQHSRN